jgi:disulfide bond formation protein DsbB
MANLISTLLPWAVLGSNILAGILLLALLFKRSWGSEIVHFSGKHSVKLGFLLSLAAVGGSLFYSNVIGFEPCILCWWQRIAIYPLLVLFAVGLKKRDRGVWSYALPLSLFGLILSLYHSYVQWGGSPLIPCSATASCAKLYVYEFGYVTIPTMVLSLAILYVLLYFANRAFQSR